MKHTFYSNGKLLITGEYLVLDGANALSLPTKFGQSLEIEPIDETKIYWKSYDDKGEVWLNFEFDFSEINSLKNNNLSEYEDEKHRLISILFEAKQLNPNFLNIPSGFNVKTKMDFPKNWGLGSSSTLINNIASWANINAFTLLENTFGGSGYDIAAAQNNQAIVYSNANHQTRIEPINLNWDFAEQLFFVHLNKKQNSRDAIKQYQSQKGAISEFKNRINTITKSISECILLSEFELLITEHEKIISNIIHQQPIKERLFPDYKGSIKSLGAWGGDFILATGDKSNWEYFKNKGYNTILSYSEMIV